ncbi:hypothetical protein N7453_003596 [Penicillium expansum]|nr:hypothetical protein N7453_003596 [Penicillium expansum]
MSPKSYQSQRKMEQEELPVALIEWLTKSPTSPTLRPSMTPRLRDSGTPSSRLTFQAFTFFADA